MKTEPISIIPTVESMQAYRQLYKEYHEMAERLNKEYLKNLDTLNRHFEDKKASQDDFPFKKTNLKKLAAEIKKRVDEHAEQEVNLREKYKDCEKYLPEDKIDDILQLLENNFNGYVPNWANIAMTTQLLLVESPNEGSYKKLIEWDTDRKIKAYSNAIKEIRLQREMSLEDIGDILEYTRQNISKIEQGKLKTFPAKKIPIIAMRLGVSPAYLLGLADQKYKPNRIECFFWEHPDALSVENNAKDPLKLIEMHKQIISYVKIYREINPEDSYRFYETDLEQAQERLKTVISDIKDNELIYSLEKILNPYSARYITAVSIIKAVSALYTMSDIDNSLFTPPIYHIKGTI